MGVGGALCIGIAAETAHHDSSFSGVACHTHLRFLCLFCFCLHNQ